MVFNFYFDKIYVYKKVVQSFYVDSLGVHLFIDIYLLSFPPSLPLSPPPSLLLSPFWSELLGAGWSQAGLLKTDGLFFYGGTSIEVALLPFLCIIVGGT